MSGIVAHDDGPSSQTLFDYSRNETYGKYINTGQHAGVIKNHHQTTNYYESACSVPLEELRKRCSPSAAFDSAARFDPPRCAESTRLRIIQVIEEWMNSDDDKASVFWLYGGAGAGKSALAQSLSEKFQEENLAASFFFFRGDSTRNNGDDLIPTLVSQLVTNLKGLTPLVEDQITEKWDIFTKGYDIQIQKLLVDPLRSLRSTDTLDFPRLIVIDGLDECTNQDVQCLLLHAIACALPRIAYPFRFLITSRPEAHITHSFNHDLALQTIPVQRYNLSDDPDADMDIRNFLEHEFAKIQKVHPLRKQLVTWPDQTAISSLVEWSSGHFIYASTVIRYIQSPKHRPDDRLEVILHLRSPQEGDRPYARLDALYGLIFGGVESRDQLEKICLVLGILYFQSKECGIFYAARYCTTIEPILGLKAGDLVLLLDPIFSLVAIDGDEIRIYHKSLFDYLLDFDRGGHLPFDLYRVHETAATYILTEKIAKAACDMEDLSIFAFHCRFGYLNNTLKDYLFSLEVPCPKFLMTTFDVLPPTTTAENFFLRKSIWNFLRTLSRQDFDSTGRIYEQYISKWITHTRRGVLEQPRPQKVDAMKVWLQRKLHKTSVRLGREAELIRNLDKVLVDWKPQNLHQPTAQIKPVRLDYIKQERRIFSDCHNAGFLNRANEISGSSLVYDDDFIHFYSFVAPNDGEHSVLIFTYSMHGNASFLSEWINLKFVEAMGNHLKEAAKRLTSDHYIKHGIEDDYVTLF